VSVEQSADLFLGAAEVSGELDLSVADRGDLRERALKVRLHLVTDGEELKPHFGDPVPAGSPTESVGEKRGGSGHGGSFQERPAIHHDYLPGN
jgi:hypothetical protein